MKNTYYIPDPDKGVFAAAIADVVLMPTNSGRRRHYVITRINVMEQYRGQGYGTRILDLILNDADAEGVSLFLEPVPSDGLDMDELTAWYERHGFGWGAWHMLRRPRSSR